MRLLPALALCASLALGACTNPDGSTDWGSTAALGVGAAAVVGIAAVAASNNNDNDDRYYDRPRYRRHYGHRHHRRAYRHRPYRRW